MIHYHRFNQWHNLKILNQKSRFLSCHSLFSVCEERVEHGSEYYFDRK